MGPNPTLKEILHDKTLLQLQTVSSLSLGALFGETFVSGLTL